MNISLSRLFFFILGAAVGALVVAWRLSPDFFTLPNYSSTTASSTASEPASSGDVDVIDQSAGSSVRVASITVRPPGVWVAVHEVHEDGSLGNILGAQFVGGPRSNIVVSLLRDTLARHSYAVVLYRDDGNGSFTPGQDSVYVDFDTGQPAESFFHTK